MVNYRGDAFVLGLGEARWPGPETQPCLFKKCKLMLDFHCIVALSLSRLSESQSNVYFINTAFLEFQSFIFVVNGLTQSSRALLTLLVWVTRCKDV